MFFNPHYSPYFSYKRAPIISYVRILHASPNTPSVNIYLDNILVTKNLFFKNFTEYSPIPTGLHNIKIFLVKNKKNPILNTNIFIPEGKIFTAAAMGLLENLSLNLISEPMKEIPENKAMIRFIHLSPDTSNLNLSYSNEMNIFEDVQYKEVTDYMPIDPNLYTFKISLSENNKVILTIPRVRFKTNRFYSMYVVGLSSNKHSLEVLIPLDGNTYLKF